MRSLRAGGSAIRSFLRRGACVEDAHALGVRLRLRCAAAQPCVGSRRAGCRSAKVNETQGGLRDAAEYSTGDAPAAAARRPLSAPACRGWARLRCGCAIGSPAWAVDAGGETTAGSCMQAPQTDPLLPSGRIPLAPAAKMPVRVVPACHAGPQRPSSGPSALPSRRRWSPGRIHSCYCYYHQLIRAMILVGRCRRQLPLFVTVSWVSSLARSWRVCAG
jgi:hypothetical protein